MDVEKARGAEMEKQFVQQMKLLREVQRISQGELASRMVNAGWEYWRQTTVSRVEKFERTVRLAEAHDIAKILGMSPAGMLTVSEEVQNQNIGAAERRRDLDDWVGRLNGSMSTLMALLEEFRTTLREGLVAPVVAEASADLAPDQDDSPSLAIQLGRAAEAVAEDYARQRQQDDDDLTKAEARDAINPEA
jgi:transcriptional regulator with XRE-family HTH domain